ncbi:MAG: PBP1A family penicillin-binding protein [Candidatus Daviesbacteria bacterium]|nr:PBP1A family penicillin-binding protein [Candidatus Daviesbacteria bacterium]
MRGRPKKTSILKKNKSRRFPVRPKKQRILHLLSKRRGRPRTQSLILFFYQKIKRQFYQAYPKSTRKKIFFAGIIVAILIYSLLIGKATTLLPSPKLLVSSERPLTTEIYDRKGKLLYQLYEGRNRQLVKLEDIPVNLINATVAIEDKHFFQHPGIDPSGIARSLSQGNISISTKAPFITAKSSLQGGSTITQQLIKNTLLTPERTLNRKIKEAILALWAERVYSKNEILQMYFNEAPFGGPAWGIEAASRMYFGKNVQDLNLAESAYLAGLPASPTEYSPYGTNPEKGLTRQKMVLQRMVEDGYITKKQAESAKLQPLTFQLPASSIKAPHFVMYVKSQLAQKYGERTVSQGGLKVTTTLDLDIQEMAENTVQNEVDKLAYLSVSNGSAMVTDAKNGQILAMVGSKNYFDPKVGNFNVALALRQPGSSIKPITYAAAFEEGFSPGTILLDSPTTFSPAGAGLPYTPVNYDGKFHGPVTIRTALGSSYNVPAVKALATVGLPKMLETARAMGITTLTKISDYGLSLTLGGGGVKMLEMMTVYGTLASGGTKYQPEAILKVTDSDGNILEENKDSIGKTALTAEVAYLLNSILSDNNARTPAFGSNSLLQIPNHTVAVKTGTSDDKRDNWTFGYNPEFVVGVWVGNNDNSPMDQNLASGVTGAAPIWHNIMVNLLAGKKDLAFKRPAGIIETNNNGQKDLAISGQTQKSIVGYQKTKKKDEATGEEKDVITYTDPFSVFIPKTL